MQIVFDNAKDISNMTKHGVSLALAAKLKWELCLAKQDTRKDYGETRIIAYAPIGTRLYCVVFVDKENERRIISLRKANQREVIQYANQI